MKKYNIGFLGAGSIFAKHQNVINGKKYFFIQGVFDKKKNIKQLENYKSQIDIFRDKNIDLIALLTPSGNHFKEILISLSYNKHVIVEKPLVLKLDQIVKINTRKNRAKKKCLLFFNID